MIGQDTGALKRHETATGEVIREASDRSHFCADFLIAYISIARDREGYVQRAAGAMERLAELLIAQPTIAAPAQPAVLPAKVSGHILFEDVTFSYPSRPDTRALDRYSLEVFSGETVAFVGPSGAGKSTTFQLLLRFYDPQAGRILIDGSDIRTWRPQDLRGRIGFVPQDTVLFGASARENIDYGRPGSSDAALQFGAAQEALAV
jgi:ATP-binding cassette, subfamily B, bacterial